MPLPLLSLEVPSPLLPGLEVEPEEARSILRPQKDERYGFGFTLSPYRGCAHGCRYCYLRDYPHPRHEGQEWGAWTSPKLNAPELLWAQRHRVHGQSVFLSTATDPYQPLERECRLTRACLKVLLDCPTTKVLLHTRSALVLRDLDLLRAFGDRLSVGFSIPTDDDTVRQVVEPKAPPIPIRWGAVERLAKAGLRVTVAATPLVPMTDPDSFARRGRECGIAGLWVGALRLLRNDPFYEVLARHRWLKVLDPDYQDEIRDRLSEALPRGPRRRTVRTCARPRPARPRCLQPVQPGLFAESCE